MLLALGILDDSVLPRTREESLLLRKIAGDALVGAYPNLSVMGCEECIDDAVVDARKVVGGKLASPLVHAYESVASAYPQHIILAFGERKHGIVGQYVRRSGIASIALEAVTIV